eukprot:s5319_g1.t1
MVPPPWRGARFASCEDAFRLEGSGVTGIDATCEDASWKTRCSRGQDYVAKSVRFFICMDSDATCEDVHLGTSCRRSSRNVFTIVKRVQMGTGEVTDVAATWNVLRTEAERNIDTTCEDVVLRATLRALTQCVKMFVSAPDAG